MYLRRLVFVLGILVFMPSYGWSKDISAKDFFSSQNKKIEIRISSKDVLVFKESDNYMYFTEGRDCIIEARSVKVVGRVIIKSFRNPAGSTRGTGAPGPDGTSRRAAGTCRNGQQGSHGRDGGDGPRGADGRDAGTVYLDMVRIKGSVLSISNTGQKGSSGGAGGRGGTGGKGGQGGDAVYSKNPRRCVCNAGDGGKGGNGGNGGNGGPGGNGGRGGAVVLTQSSMKLMPKHLAIDVSAGEGGTGGRGGMAGNGGAGGQAGRRIGTCGSGRNGVQGNRGSEGRNGPHGENGTAGVISEAR